MILPPLECIQCCILNKEKCCSHIYLKSYCKLKEIQVFFLCHIAPQLRERQTFCESKELPSMCCIQGVSKLADPILQGGDLN